MKAKTWWLVAAGTSALVAFGAFAAQEVGPQAKEKHVMRFLSAHVDNMLDDVNATDAQRTQVQQLKQQLFEEGKALHGGMEAAHEELRTQWKAAQPDKARVDQLVDERIDALRGFAHKVTDAALKLHGILTPEQREKLSAMHEEHRHHW